MRVLRSLAGSALMFVRPCNTVKTSSFVIHRMFSSCGRDGVRFFALMGRKQQQELQLLESTRFVARKL